MPPTLRPAARVAWASHDAPGHRDRRRRPQRARRRRLPRARRPEVLVLERRASSAAPRSASARSPARRAAVALRLPRLAVPAADRPRPGIDLRLLDRPVAAYAPVVRDGRRDRPARRERRRSAATADVVPRGHRRRRRARGVPGLRRGDPTRAERAVPARSPSRCRPRAQARDLLGAEALARPVERPLGETLDERFADGLVRGMVATDGADRDVRLAPRGLAAPEPLLPLPRDRRRGAGGCPPAGWARSAARSSARPRDAGAELRTRRRGAGHRPRRARSPGARTATSTPSPPATCWPTSRPPCSRGCSASGRRRARGRAAEGQPAARPAARAALGHRPCRRVRRHVPRCTRTTPSSTPPTSRRAAASCPSPPARRALLPHAHRPVDRRAAHAPHADAVRPARARAAVRRRRGRRPRDTLVERYLDGARRAPRRADPRLPGPRRATAAPCLEARTPLDLERELGLPGGNIFHGDLAGPGATTTATRWGVATGARARPVCGAGARRGGGGQRRGRPQRRDGRPPYIACLVGRVSRRRRGTRRSPMSLT